MSNRAKKNKIYKSITVFALLIMVALFFIQLQSKSVVESFLERKIPSHIALTYDDLDVSILSGTIQFSAINLKIRDRDTTIHHTDITIKDVKLTRLSYWEFFFKNTIKAREISVESPFVTYYPSKTFRKKTDKPKGVVNLIKKIAIEKIAISNGGFDMTNQQSDSAKVSARKINFSLVNGRTDSKTIKKKIPITYESYDFSAKELFVDLGLYETVKANTFQISETNAMLTNLILKTKYSKALLSKVIKKERDHIDLKVPECSLKNIDFGFNDNRFFFTSKLGEISDLNLNIYRDKSIADDLSIKNMYSSVLRELPFDLDIDSLNVTNSKVKYEENIKSYSKAGSLFFDNLSLGLYNISNIYEAGNETVAKVEGKLMGIAPFSVSYRFDINDKDDSFKVATTLYGLQGKDVNSFLRPNVNAQIKGKVDELYFTAYGNENALKGDIKMKYKDLKFEIFKKDRQRINKILSAIGNLFINDGSNADAQGYRYGTIDVKRDRSKSMFNYFWLCTQDGLLSTLTGDGRKEISSENHLNGR